MQISLAAARVNKGLTQEQSAKALKVNKKTICSWEKGRTVPQADQIPAICALYGVTYDDIKWRA